MYGAVAQWESTRLKTVVSRVRFSLVPLRIELENQIPNIFNQPFYSKKMGKRVLISRLTGADSERDEVDKVEKEIRLKQAGLAPVYTPTQETLTVREQIQNYRPISRLTPEELQKLRIKYFSQ
jgi:hypothetical protein